MTHSLRLTAAVTMLVAAAVSASARAPEPADRSWPQDPVRAIVSLPSGTSEWQRLLAEGEARLAEGDAAGAEQAFDTATRLVHSADTELSLVRAYMQAGAYRRALAFGAHAAGAHPETPAGMALYAWLLHVGGQGRVAARMLTEASARAPGDAALQQARTRLADPWPTAAGVLLEGPWRTAPRAWGATVPETARVVGSGVLVDGGRAALLPTHLLDDGRRVWVRNGLGQTTEAFLESRLAEAPLTRVRLATPLPAPSPLRRSTREPFAGSPNYMLEYAPGDGSLPAWPLLRQGFFGSVPRNDGLRPLGIVAPPGPRGGPVFDAAGQLVGAAIVDDTRANRVVFASRMGQQVEVEGAPRPPRPVNASLPIDELYERGLVATLQVILDDRGGAR